MGQRRSTEGEAELNLLGPDPMVVSLVVCRAARVATTEASLHPAGGKSVGPALVAPWGEVEAQSAQAPEQTPVLLTISIN